ncbi:MAG: NifB/NifX family molybdenum-iron cluster-binding protein [Anaerolineales bacterium]|nr:NifB/NifX family molybdenum-iron cluster-binding protein [Anaerolineales bacterium]
MKFAISTEDNKGLESNVSQHFGRCPYFILVDLEDEAVKEVKVVDNPYFAQHSPGQVPEYIASLGVNVMISGGMGRRANDFFDNFGIKTATGAIGTVQEALSSFQDGNLADGGSCCGHGDGHGHGQGHGQGGCKDHAESE